MTVERKFIDLKSLKVSDEGPGMIEGYRSVFNVIDEGGDMIIPGAFKDCLDEYLHSGFTAQSHDWDFKEAVGFPVEAKEDEHGWFVRSQFHSTPDAQAIRTKAKERLEAGKQVGFSFGYAPTEFSHIESKDYETELAKYVKPENLQETLAKAQKFNRVRILKKVDAIEDSLVTAPMNKRAAATAIKSDKETKGMLAEEMAATTPSIWEVESAFHRVVRKLAQTAKDSAVTGAVIDVAVKVNELIAEYGMELSPLVISQINEFLENSDDEFYLKGSVADSFESFEKAVAALEKNTANMRRNHENRVKEGRVLSSSNRAKVQACRDSLQSLMTDLDDLLVLTEPKPKEKEIDVEALRTQSMRLRSKALSALAR